MMTGNTRHHEALEAQLAEHVGKERSLVFSSGYLGVFGCLSAVLQRGDIVLMDEQSHACMFDGAQITGCHLRCYRHNDMDELEAMLKWARGHRKKGVLIATEGVFGMRGDIAPLDWIAELKAKYEATLFVDDAHGFGVMGERGEGTPSLFERGDAVDLYYGTFSKAFASLGGVAASTRPAIDWLTFNARSNIFTKSLPLAYVAVISRALEIVRYDVERRRRLFHNTALLKDGMRELGFDLPQYPSPITALFLPCESLESVKALVMALRERGVFITAVVHPVVPKGVVCLRMIPTASHTEEQIALTLQVFEDVLARVGFRPQALGAA